MRRILMVVGVLVLCGGCRTTDTTLDDAIAEFLDVRRQRGEQLCDCFQMFIDVNDPDAGTFMSREQCLAANPKSGSSSAECIREILEAGPYDTNGNVELMECYAAATQSGIQCFAEQVEDGCSAMAEQECGMSASQAFNACSGQLSSDQAEAIIYCTAE